MTGAVPISGPVGSGSPPSSLLVWVGSPQPRRSCSESLFRHAQMIPARTTTKKMPKPIQNTVGEG